MTPKPAHFCGLALDRPIIMGILNLTPDSFSDGGRWLEPASALAHAIEMIREGADILDLGGESTRPGSAPVPPEEQARRVVPVVRAIREWLDANPRFPADNGNQGQTRQPVRISIDTGRPEVAHAALQAGADLVNDVFGARETDAHGRTTADVAAEAGAGLILMHMQGTPQTMQQSPSYTDVIQEVHHYLHTRAAWALTRGVRPDALGIDPGIGFGKTKEHNLALLGALDRFVGMGYPVLLGTSRKRFMGAVCTRPDGGTPTPTELVGATCATTALGVLAGVQMFRVHDVRENRQAADIAWRVGRS